MLNQSTSLKVAISGPLLLGLCLLAIGCGSGDETASAAAPLTKPQFLKRAKAICQAELQKKEEFLTSTFEKKGKAPLDASPSELEDVASGVFKVYSEMLSRLAELTPPPDDQAKVEKFMGEWESTLKEAEADPSIVFNEPFEEANEAATRYGLYKACGLY
jgi:hypothetical protein